MKLGLAHQCCTETVSDCWHFQETPSQRRNIDCAVVQLIKELTSTAADDTHDIQVCSKPTMFLRRRILSSGCRKQKSTAWRARSRSCGRVSLKAPAASAYSRDNEVPNTPLSSVHRTTGCPAPTGACSAQCIAAARRTNYPCTWGLRTRPGQEYRPHERSAEHPRCERAL